MAEFNETLSEDIIVVEETTYTLVSEHPYYGTINEADRYFGVLLHGELWDKTNSLRKYKALVSATKLIDDLRFAGSKTDSSQTLEFPRNGAAEVPLAIRQACYEIALALLRGVQSETEYDNLFVKYRKFGPIETDYDFSSIPDHKKAGIPSLTAWQKLLPYLKPAIELRLRREN